MAQRQQRAKEDTRVTFTVGPPFKSSEDGWANYVFFMIKTEVTAPPPSSSGSSNVHPAYPKPPYVDSSSRRRPLSEGQIETERRYSELVLLRDLLELLYPMIVIPPLPAKTVFDNASSMFSIEHIMDEQRRSIRRFLNDLAQLPGIIDHCEYLGKFFQLTRDEFKTEFTRLQNETLPYLKQSVAHIEAHRVHYERPVTGGNIVTNALTSGSSTLKRMFTSFIGGPETGAVDSGEIRARLSQDMTFTKWQFMLSSIREQISAVRVATDDVYKMVGAVRNMFIALGDLTDALQSLSDTYYESTLSEVLRTDTAQVAGMPEVMQMDLEKLQSQLVIRVAEWFTYERLWLEAAERAIEFLLCLRTWDAEMQVDGALPLNQRNAINNFVGTADGVLARYVSSTLFRAGFRRRMGNTMRNLCVLWTNAYRNTESNLLRSDYRLTNPENATDFARKAWDQCNELPWESDYGTSGDELRKEAERRRQAKQQRQQQREQQQRQQASSSSSSSQRQQDEVPRASSSSASASSPFDEGGRGRGAANSDDGASTRAAPRPTRQDDHEDDDVADEDDENNESAVPAVPAAAPHSPTASANTDAAAAPTEEASEPTEAATEEVDDSSPPLPPAPAAAAAPSSPPQASSPSSSPTQRRTPVSTKMPWEEDL